jgi:hypothetical protein
MDALIAAAARALAVGDAVLALKHVALRSDPPALALRGIAMAQLGELARARELLQQAARDFGPHEALQRARCVVAGSEVALALRDLAGPTRSLDVAAAVLHTHGDTANAQQARLIAVRRGLLLGRLAEAAATLALVEAERPATPVLAAVAALAAAEIAWRTLQIDSAQQALARAQAAAERTRVPTLKAEVAEAQAQLQRPAAQRWQADGRAAQPMTLGQVQALVSAGVLVVDGCRRGLRQHDGWWPLARRPVLLALARALAEGWPGEVPREVLIERAFRLRQPDDTHRARLRVEIGRLRALAAPLARIEATARGYALRPHHGMEVALLLPPIDGEAASLQALLADGAAWSTSALALALGESQRNVQRTLAELQAAGRVRAIGRGRAQRWLAPPLAGFTTILLLPAALPFA